MEKFQTFLDVSAIFLLIIIWKYLYDAVIYSFSKQLEYKVILLVIAALLMVYATYLLILKLRKYI